MEVATDVATLLDGCRNGIEMVIEKGDPVAVGQDFASAGPVVEGPAGTGDEDRR